MAVCYACSLNRAYIYHIHHVFNPLPETSKKPNDPHKHQKSLKKVKYPSRIRNVERNSFALLIFSSTRGTKSFAQKLIQQLDEKVSGNVMSHTVTL